MAVNATPSKGRRKLGRFGHYLGLAFQVIDDILDITQTSEKLGKSAGKDIAAQKTTYPALIGLEPARREARRPTASAQTRPRAIREEWSRLRQLADLPPRQGILSPPPGRYS